MTCTLKNMIELLEEACTEEERILRVHNVTEENLKTAFAAFQNRPADLARINSLSVSGCLLPAVTSLLEPGNIEEMVLLSGNTDIHWPFMEKYHRLAELTIRQTHSIPESIGKLQSLTLISLEGNKNLKTLPDSIGSLQNLAYLRIYASCLEQLPETLGNLQSLNRLILEGNKKLKALPQSIGSLKNLAHLDISGSNSITNLPDSVINLNALEYVNIRGTAIQTVPASITQVKKYIDNKRHTIIPQEASLSSSNFMDSYHLIAETISRFSRKAIEEGLSEMADELAVVEDEFFDIGIKLAINETDKQAMRQILTTYIKHEQGHYRKKLMTIAMEGILDLQDSLVTSDIISKMNRMAEQ